MTQQDLMAQFQQQNPGVDINSPDGQNAFSSWVSQQPSTGPGGGPNTNPFSPTGTNLNDAANAALLSGANKAAGGGNTYQVQGGNQSGEFKTGGAESTDTTQRQYQQGHSTGTQTQDTTSQGTTTGIGTSVGAHNVQDTLGFGKLLQDQAPQAQNADQNRNAYLTDLVNTGGSGFNQQVDAAVRQSQSGPGMQGVGESGQARAAAYATEAVARDNQNQRLAASGQLAGPTATQTLAASGNPYLGSTDTNIQANTSNTQGKQSTTGTTSQDTSSLGSLFANTLSNQTQQGTSNANNTQIAAGNQPEQGSSKSGGGGSVICSALVERGMLDKAIAHAEVDFVKENWDTFKRAAKGYYSFGVPIAKLVRRSRLVALLCWPLASACSKEAARRHGLPINRRWWRTLAYAGFFGVCDTIGRFVHKEPRITDIEMLCMLNSQGLNLNQH